MRKPFFYLLVLCCLVQCTGSCSREDLAGKDKNGTGVRDDVEEWINKNILDKHARFWALETARSYQAQITDSPDYKRYENSHECLFQESIKAKYPDLLQEIESRMLNTRARAIAKFEFDSKHYNGKMLSVPFESPDFCKEAQSQLDRK